MVFHNLQSHLAYQYIKICVLTRHTFCESLVKLGSTKRKCRSFLRCFFFRHRAVLPNCPEEQYRRGTIKIIYLTFSKYFRPLHKLVQAGARTQTTDDYDRQNSRITDRQTILLDLSETCLYMVHFGPGSYFRKLQKKFLQPNFLGVLLKP